MPEPPSCTLRPEERERRYARFASLASAALEAAERTAAGARIRLPDERPVREEVGALVEAERRCCSFLDFAVEAEAGELVVEVSGPPSAQELIERLFEAGHPREVSA